ncbi:MAG: hypothetical protein ACP5LX_06740 [Nitrososphaeria archaeon]|jgi:hypothetical protein|nr:hypothetical protein [TACK group archaeon]
MHEEREAGFFTFARWGLGGVLIIFLIVFAAIAVLMIGKFSLFSEVSAAVLFIALIIYVLVKKSERIVLPSNQH